MRQLGSWPAYVSGAVAMALVASVGSGVAPTRVAPAASAAPTIPVIEDTGEPERQLVPS